MTTLLGQELCCVRGGKRIVDAVTATANSGEFIGVIGPNGAGKSTLLALLAGLQRPDAGKVWLDDRPLQKFAARELAQRRAYLPQQARCEWPLPVWRLVGLGLTPTLPAWGDFSAADRERIDTVLRECDLLERREQSVATLSGGELARALFARTLVGDPQLLIVDEPLASLDPAHAHDALRRMRHLARVQDKVVIASLHDPNAVLGYCSRVLMLKGGRLIADGVPAEVMTAATLRTVYDVEARVIHHNGQSITTFGSP